MVLAAAANERSSATFANIASPSKSGSFDIDNPATMTFIHFYFKNRVPPQICLASTRSSSAFRTVKSTPFTLRPNVSSYCSSVIDPNGSIATVNSQGEML